MKDNEQLIMNNEELESKIELLLQILYKPSTKMSPRDFDTVVEVIKSIKKEYVDGQR